MTIKVFNQSEKLTAQDTNEFLANSGLVYVSGGTKSGANSYAFDSVFTSSFQNYRVVVDQLSVASANRAIRLQFRTGGSTNTVSNYNYAYRGLKSDGSGNDTSNANGSFVEVGVFIDTASTELGSFICDIFDPQLAKRTRALSSGQGQEGAAGWRNGGFEFYGTTAFDGFLLGLNSTGNFSFTFTIYGYRNV